MKLSKEDLKKKIDEFDVSEDVKIELLEDIEDSFDSDFKEDDYVKKDDYERLKSELEESRKKYKERFFESKDEKEDESEDEKEDESEDEKIIDVKDIFEETEEK